MTNQQKVLEKVRKLLETTVENGATAEESQSAVMMAQKLLAKHNLEMADVKVVAGGPSLAPETFDVRAAGKLNWWEKMLAKTIVDNFRCEVYLQRTGRNASKIVFLGEPADLEVAKNVYEFALAQIEHHAKAYRRKRRKEYKAENLTTDGFDGIAVRNDFMTGYLKGLDDKLKEQVEASEEMALMVQKPDSVVKAYNDMNLKNSSVNVRSGHDSAARGAGYKRGKQFSNPSGSIEG